MKMVSELVDRVETKRFEKYRKRTLMISCILMALGVVKLIIGSSHGSYQNIGYWADTIPLYFIFPIGTLTILYGQKNRSGQFIEWFTDKVVYRSTGDKQIMEALYADVCSVDIHLDEIELTMMSGQKQIINIADHTDYDTRLKIKANFGSIKPQEVLAGSINN